VKIQPKGDLIVRQWQDLAKICDDRESQTRPAMLWDHLSRFPLRQAASAHAEIETAYFLAQAGFFVAFLEASGGRTADLECYEGTHRFFVEVTVIQSTQGANRKSPAVRLQPRQILESSDEFFEQALVKRLLSRMAEKARQLERYCAPVLLAVSVPDLPWRHGRPQAISPLDLQAISRDVSRGVSRRPSVQCDPAHVMEGAGSGIPQSHSHSPGILGDSTTRGSARSSNSIVGSEPGSPISAYAQGTPYGSGCDVNETLTGKIRKSGKDSEERERFDYGAGKEVLSASRFLMTSKLPLLVATVTPSVHIARHFSNSCAW